MSEYDRARLFLAPLSHSHQHPQIMNHVLEFTRLQPALSLLVNDVSGRQTIGHSLLGNAATHDMAQTVKDFSQRMFSARVSSFIKAREGATNIRSPLLTSVGYGLLFLSLSIGISVQEVFNRL
jgi:hypothetical protein